MNSGCRAPPSPFSEGAAQSASIRKLTPSLPVSPEWSTQAWLRIPHTLRRFDTEHSAWVAPRGTWICGLSPSKHEPMEARITHRCRRAVRAWARSRWTGCRMWSAVASSTIRPHAYVRPNRTDAMPSPPRDVRPYWAATAATSRSSARSTCGSVSSGARTAAGAAQPARDAESGAHLEIRGDTRSVAVGTPCAASCDYVRIRARGVRVDRFREAGHAVHDRQVGDHLFAADFGGGRGQKHRNSRIDAPDQISRHALR